MTHKHASLEIYTSHFIRKGCEKVMRERSVGDWTNCNILTPHPSVFSGTSFSFRWAAQPGALGAQPSAESWFSMPRTATTDSKLTELPVAPGYIIVCRPPVSCGRHICTQFNPSTVKVIPWYLRPDAPVPWSTAGSEVNLLQGQLYSHSHCLESLTLSLSLTIFSYVITLA